MKMDLTETMKQVLAKVSGNAQGLSSAAAAAAAAAANSSVASHAALMQQQHHLQQQQQQQQNQHPELQQNSTPGVGYVTEKLYMLLQLYLQNKGWNPSIELLQCFSELKDSALLPSAAYLQVLANRLALDAQGRLVLRESGKIVLPYEHFANAVMLKHMTGPHGLHLSLEATVRSVVESYTIGRENFGMEKEFIIEVVQSCPNPACRYYKTHMGNNANFMDAAFQSALGGQGNVDFMQQLQNAQQQSALLQQNLATPSPSSSSSSAAAAAAVTANSVPSAIIDMTQMDTSAALKQFPSPLHQNQNHSNSSAQHQRAASMADKQMKYGSAAQQHQITAAIIQQQNRAIAQQNLEKFGNMSSIEKQRVLQQLDKKQFDASMMHTDSRGHDRSAIQSSHLPSRSPQLLNAHAPIDLQPTQSHKVNDFSSSKPVVEVSLLDSPTNKDLLALHNGAWAQSSTLQNLSARDTQSANNLNLHHSQQQQQQPPPPQQQQQQQQQQPSPQASIQSQSYQQLSPAIGQENIVRVFDELMKNMARMKQFIRPSMCKPYGKQSESLQKTLMDTIQIVQSLRNCIPAPAIPINSWKNEDRNV